MNGRNYQLDGRGDGINGRRNGLERQFQRDLAFSCSSARPSPTFQIRGSSLGRPPTMVFAQMPLEHLDDDIQV